MKCRRFNAYFVFGGAKAHGPGIFKLHIRVVQQQPREAGVHHQAFRVLEVAFHCYVAVRGSVPRNVLHVKRGEQEGIESNILETDFAAERIRIS